ncbi:MAG: hypothetical protein GQE15_25570 [Archangiaceae bacterium]|nr:hypothetical protein [Archangiaceae bacterium]
MRVWRTADGALLVEWKAERAARLPDGREVATASFLRIEGDAVTRESWWNESSLEDWLYTTAFFVDGDCLKSCFRGERYGGGETCTVSVELSGLTVVPAPPEADLRAIVGKHHERKEQHHRRALAVEEARDRSFVAALRPVSGTAPVVLVFALDGMDWVVHRGGEIWWRERDWPWLGKGLRDKLAPLVKAHYAPRPATLEVDSATWQSMSYAND